MTVETTSSRATYVGDGFTKTFPAPFVFLMEGHLQVVLADTAGSETLQALSTDYTVSGAGDPIGGIVTMAVAPASGETLVVRRVVPLTQTSDLEEGTKFPSSTLEAMADRNTMMAQQLSEEVSRVLRAPVAEATIGDLPTLGARANKGLGFDAAGDPAAFNLTVAGDVRVTSAMAKFLDTADFAAARKTLSVPGVADNNTFTGTTEFNDTVTFNGGVDFDWRDLGDISGDLTIDPRKGPKQYGTLVGAVTLFGMNIAGDVELWLSQDTTGGHGVNADTATIDQVAEIPTLLTGANDTNIILAERGDQSTKTRIGALTVDLSQ